MLTAGSILTALLQLLPKIPQGRLFQTDYKQEGREFIWTRFQTILSGSGCQQGKKTLAAKKKKAFQCGSVVKKLPANVGSGDVGLIPDRGQGGGGKIPCSRKWQHTSVFLPGKLHGGLQSTGSQRIWHNQQLSTRAGRERAAVWLLSYILQFYPSAHLLSQSPESSVVFLETSAKCLVPPKFF